MGADRVMSYAVPSMRIITLNANGIRAATRKGFWSWLGRQRADVVCLQEVRAQADQRPPEVARLRSWRAYWHDAEKKGYGGVGLLSRDEPDRIVYGMGIEDIDREGRYLQADFGRLSVVSLYVPSGTSGAVRQAFKMAALDRLRDHLGGLRRTGRQVVVCGDFNIAHRKIDIENWRSNQNHSGFLPEERAWMDELFGPAGWVDSFRVVNAEPRQYTWWSNRGRAWEKNVGWRIDYQVVTPGLAQTVRAASIYRRKRFSDHAPLRIDYEIAELRL